MLNDSDDDFIMEVNKDEEEAESYLDKEKRKAAYK
jgi:hypothetical protein